MTGLATVPGWSVLLSSGQMSHPCQEHEPGAKSGTLCLCQEGTSCRRTFRPRLLPTLTPTMPPVHLPVGVALPPRPHAAAIARWGHWLSALSPVLLTGSKNPKIALKLAEFQTDRQGKVRPPEEPAGVGGSSLCSPLPRASRP